MPYDTKVLKYCLEPKNCRGMNPQDPHVGCGQVGSASCGDVITLFLRIEEGTIVDASFKAFGCGSAIAASALGTEMLPTKTLEQAKKDVTNDYLFNELKLPAIKRHCSILVEECINAAIDDYNSKKHLREMQV